MPLVHNEENVRRQSSAFMPRRPVLTGIAVGLATLAPHGFLSPAGSVGYAAVVISLIAGVYFGFAVMNGSPRDQLVEFCVAGVFAVAALLGFLVWPTWLPIAYFAHALWDFAHHNRLRFPLVVIPAWYVPWCVVIDVIVGAGLLAIWRAHDLL
ncbi:MAG: hypothetical protein IPJ97_05940 [Proteobacteria bacterium]|nr:hypothetical protein [Pseudomonadota bacterium]